MTAHYLLTRAVYHPSLWPAEANRRRLEVFRGVTVASVAAQPERDWTWLLAVSAADELLEERLEAARGAGVEVVPIRSLEPGRGRTGEAANAYRLPWEEALGKGPRLTTRIDDDDAFAPDAFARIREEAATPTRDRVALILPAGYRVWGGRFDRIRHESNAWATLSTPPGDSFHVYSYAHREVRRHARVVLLGNRPAWLWVRHPDALSGHHAAAKPITDTLRAKFPIEWSVIEPRRPAPAREGYVSFR